MWWAYVTSISVLLILFIASAISKTPMYFAGNTEELGKFNYTFHVSAAVLLTLNAGIYLLDPSMTISVALSVIYAVGFSILFLVNWGRKQKRKKQQISFIAGLKVLIDGACDMDTLGTYFQDANFVYDETFRQGHFEDFYWIKSSMGLSYEGAVVETVGKLVDLTHKPETSWTEF